MCNYNVFFGSKRAVFFVNHGVVDNGLFMLVLNTCNFGSETSQFVSIKTVIVELSGKVWRRSITTSFIDRCCQHSWFLRCFAGLVGNYGAKLRPLSCKNCLCVSRIPWHNLDNFSRLAMSSWRLVSLRKITLVFWLLVWQAIFSLHVSANVFPLSVNFVFKSCNGVLKVAVVRDIILVVHITGLRQFGIKFLFDHLLLSFGWLVHFILAVKGRWCGLSWLLLLLDLVVLAKWPESLLHLLLLGQFLLLSSLVTRLFQSSSQVLRMTHLPLVHQTRVTHRRNLTDLLQTLDWWNIIVR